MKLGFRLIAPVTLLKGLGLGKLRLWRKVIANKKPTPVRAWVQFIEAVSALGQIAEIRSYKQGLCGESKRWFYIRQEPQVQLRHP